MNLTGIKYSVIDMAKMNKFLLPIYRKIKTLETKRSFKIDKIPIPDGCVDKNKKIRINLVLPTLRRTKVFAGINTAIRIFTKLYGERFDARIIIVSQETNDPRFIYKIEENGENEIEEVFLSQSIVLPIRINDFFVMTSWKTAYAIQDICKWQKQTFKLNDRRFFYLIQDFEPGFFPWTTEYALAEMTYKIYSSSIAVFNSHELHQYFVKHGYRFDKEYEFTPVLNPVLKDCLLKNEINKNRKKRILIYGRPSEPRNAFELIRYALVIWSKEYSKAKEWSIISLGEEFEDIKLPNNIIKSKGKVTLEDYANYMSTSYVGISLMISPHPSYPPLEMSTFGVKTITNTFENKDLSNFNGNIISLSDYSPSNIAKTLENICEKFPEESEIEVNENYLKEDGIDVLCHSLIQLIDEICK